MASRAGRARGLNPTPRPRGPDGRVLFTRGTEEMDALRREARRLYEVNPDIFEDEFDALTALAGLTTAPERLPASRTDRATPVPTDEYRHRRFELPTIDIAGDVAEPQAERPRESGPSGSGYSRRVTHGDGARNAPDVAFRFGRDPSASRLARRALAPIVGTGSFAENVNVALAELVTNVVRHTDAGGRMHAWDGDPLRLEVHDTSSVLPRLGLVSDEGGRGLHIVDAVSAAWGAEPTNEGKMVWAEFRRPTD
jgi:serine/threonine-protein kinase RsbW